MQVASHQLRPPRTTCCKGMGDKQGWSQEIIDDWLLRKSAKIPDSYPYTVTLGEVIDIPMISFPPVLEDASLRARFPRNSSHIAVPPPPPPNMKSAKCSLKVHVFMSAKFRVNKLGWRYRD